jgi:flagellar biosynthesis/type III secretory pathway M-ring protein FliF/YscJ
MDFTKQFSRLAAELKELLRKLTVSQKITLGLLGFLIAAGVVVAVTLARGDSYVRLGGGGDPKTLAAMKSLLDQHGILYRISTEGGGTALEVTRERAAHARWLAAEGGITTAKDSNLDWLFGEPSFLDTENRVDQRLLESRKRTVEDALRWSPGIRDARIVVQRGPEPIYAARTASTDSAAVAVALRPGVASLSRMEAGAIRSLVAGAFNIPPQNIQVTDDHLRKYAYLDSTAAGLSEDEDRTQKQVLTTVDNLLRGIYRPAEFVVGVLVDLSSRRSQVVKVTYDPEKVATAERETLKETETNHRGPGGAVGVAPNVSPAGGLGSAEPAGSAGEKQSREKKQSSIDNRFSNVEEKIEVPAGELKGLSVNVVLDRAAVRRVLQAEEFTRLTPQRKDSEKVQGEADIVNFTVEGKVGAGNLDQAIEAHRRSEAEFLKEQLPMSGAKVNVSVVMFPKPEMPAVLAASTRTLGWAADHWNDLLLGTVAVVGLFLVYRMFGRALPQPLDVPALDESALEEETRAADAEIAQLEAQLASAAGGAGGLPGGAGRLGDSVEAVNTLTRSHPETASAVIRLWMADKAPKE